MGKYLLRVQLSAESRTHYTMLRDGLINIGFTKRIKDKYDVEWRLPNGNYYIESNSDGTTILNAATKVALSVDRNPQLFLAAMKDTGSVWIGLERC